MHGSWNNPQVDLVYIISFHSRYERVYSDLPCWVSTKEIPKMGVNFIVMQCIGVHCPKGSIRIAPSKNLKFNTVQSVVETSDK